MSARVGRGVAQGRQAEGVGRGGSEGGRGRARRVPKKSVLPYSSPTKASRSPSPSTSANVGADRSPTSARPKGLVDGRREGRCCSPFPCSRRRRVAVTSPRERIQVAVVVDVGEGRRRAKPDVQQAEGVGRGGAKAGALAVPVFSKKNMLPYRSPMKASRSPSPSMSTARARS